MRHAIPLVALLVLLTAAGALPAQRPSHRAAARADARAAPPTDSAVRALIRGRVEAGHSVGIVVGLLDPDGRRRVIAYGASGTARPLDGATVFEIGSVTKTFTAALLASMAARGEVRLDDPVSAHLPEGAAVPSRDGRAITLLDLATQSSGLPRMPSNLVPADPANPYAGYTEAQLYAFLASYALPRAPGAEYEYSNLGFGLLGQALAHRGGADLETLLRRRVLDSLGMGDTRIALSASMRERLAVGHGALGHPVGLWDMPTLGGAGALRSTANDMLVWLAANLAADADSTADSTRVDPAHASLRAALRLTHVRRHDAGGTMGIGLAWHLRRTPEGDTIVWHNGGTGGYHTFVGYDARRRSAVVVLTNSNAGEDDIGFHLLASSFAPARTPAALPAAVLARYVGEYALAPNFHLVITREPSGLGLQATDQAKLPLFASSEREFFLDAVDAQITFQVDATGRVTGLVLHQGGADQPAPKIR